MVSGVIVNNPCPYYNLDDMALFTVVLDFDGGMYITQLRVASIKAVPQKYAAHLAANQAIGRIATRQRLAESIKEDKPVAVDGVRNVWCCCASVGKKFGLMNIVMTAE